MYFPTAHAERDPAVLQEFIRQYPLGLLTTSITHPTLDTIQSTHLPFVLDTPDGGPAVLRAHITRANPQAKALISTVGDKGLLDSDVCLIFQAPISHYVTPKFYTTTKPDTGKVVPTWNYIAVQAYGKLRLHHSGPEAAKFLQKQIEDLSLEREKAAGYKENPWEVSEAPEKFLELLKRAIIGIEIEVTRLEGRWKLSQEMGDGDWAGVVKGFKALGTPEGQTMARVIEERGQQRSIVQQGLL